MNKNPSKKIEIKEKTNGMKGVVRCIKRNAKTGKIISDHIYENLVVNVCFNMIADRLAGGSNDTDITYGAVGTDNTAPAATDTTLGVENTRKALASISASGAVVTATTFLGSADANVAIEEFGLFGNGATAAADSGTLINRALISEVKTSSETITIEATLTLS